MVVSFKKDPINEQLPIKHYHAMHEYNFYCAQIDLQKRVISDLLEQLPIEFTENPKLVNKLKNLKDCLHDNIFNMQVITGLMESNLRHNPRGIFFIEREQGDPVFYANQPVFCWPTERYQLGFNKLLINPT